LRLHASHRRRTVAPCPVRGARGSPGRPALGRPPAALALTA
jgi:hypothetical protein